MASVGLVLLWFFLLGVQMSHQKINDGVSPVLTVNVLNSHLNQYEEARVALGGGAAVVTCEDADGDQIRAYIAAISPTSGCGLKCLQMEPCTAGDNKEYCLWYVPTDGSLQYLSQTTYTLTIGCTDDLEPITSGSISLNVVANTAPAFNVTSVTETISPRSITHRRNYKIYKAEAVDADGDPITYTMSTNPLTSLIEIEPKSGLIRATQDLAMLCEEKIEVSVWARDPYNTASDPLLLEILLDSPNERPTITNLDTTVTIDENVFVDKRVIEMDIVDRQLTDHTFNQKSVTDAGLEAHGIRSPSIRTKIVLDYEREDTRSTKLYFDVHDNYCISEIYSLTVDVNDLPEEPKLSHTEMLIMTDEGQINQPSNVFVIDDDLNEKHTFTVQSGTASEFYVDALTGNIVSYTDVLLKPGVKFKNYRVRLRVVDKDGLQTDRYEATVRVFDINNNKPYFTNANDPLTVSAHECLPAGTILGTLKGADDDSEYNLNNWVYFGGGGEYVDVAANGWIVLSQQCTKGKTYSGTATISDQGINPGPLTGDDLQLLLICGPCPVATTDKASDSSSELDNSASSSSGGIWEVPAVLLFAVWLGLTTALLCRFWKDPCSKCRSRPKRINVKPEKSLPVQPNQAKPAKPATRPPKPAPQPRPKGLSVPLVAPRTVSPSEPYLMGFWSKPYTNQHQISQPDGSSKPKAIEDMPPGEGNEAPPDHLRLGPPGSEKTTPRFLPGNANSPPASIRNSTQLVSKKSFCIIS